MDLGPPQRSPLRPNPLNLARRNKAGTPSKRHKKKLRFQKKITSHSQKIIKIKRTSSRRDKINERKSKQIIKIVIEMERSVTPSRQQRKIQVGRR